MPKAIPDGFNSVSAHIVVEDGNAGMDWYMKALGAEEVMRMPGPGGTLMHGQIRIGNSIVMISGEFPGMEEGCQSPATVGGTTCNVHVYTEDCDAMFNGAIEAGATVRYPLENAFWGDRYGMIKDPFGHIWSFATKKEDLTDGEIAKRAEDFMAKMKGGG